MEHGTHEGPAGDRWAVLASLAHKRKNQTEQNQEPAIRHQSFLQGVVFLVFLEDPETGHWARPMPGHHLCTVTAPPWVSRGPGTYLWAHVFSSDNL